MRRACHRGDSSRRCYPQARQRYSAPRDVRRATCNARSGGLRLVCGSRLPQSLCARTQFSTAPLPDRARTALSSEVRTRRGAEGRRCGCEEVRRRAQRCTGAEWHGGNDCGLEKALESAVRHVAHPESSTNCALGRRAGAGGARLSGSGQGARERAGAGGSGRRAGACARGTRRTGSARAERSGARRSEGQQCVDRDHERDDREVDVRRVEHLHRLPGLAPDRVRVQPVRLHDEVSAEYE